MLDPEFLSETQSFVSWLYEQPEVLHVLSITDIMKRLNKSMHGDDQNWYRLPDDREMSAQYFLLYELSLPYGLDVTNMVNLDRSATRVVVNLVTIESLDLIAFDHRVNAWLKENLRQVESTDALSVFIIMAYLAQQNATDMLMITALALVGISSC